MRKTKRHTDWIGLGACSFLVLLAVPFRLSAQGPSESFNGGRAFADLKQLVSYGPRPAGSPALAEARRWMIGQLKDAGAQVEEDALHRPDSRGRHPHDQPYRQVSGPATQNRDGAGHYDTKLFEDFRFVGANDGASSAALLLELARELHGRKHAFTYWLVFFDGEEAVREWTDTDSLYGSRHLVQKLSSAGELGRIQAMILVDMIGDANLEIHREANSTPWLTEPCSPPPTAWDTRSISWIPRTAVDDDHIPFVNAGVAAVDLIDFNYARRRLLAHGKRYG